MMMTEVDDDCWSPVSVATNFFRGGNKAPKLFNASEQERVKEDWSVERVRFFFKASSRAQSLVLSSVITGEHVLGFDSFLYSTDVRRSDLQDAASEVARTSLREASLVCWAWRDLAAPILEWERERAVEERRLLLDSHVFPLVAGVHLAPIPRPMCDGGRFVKLPFKEGDTLVVDCAKLAEACSDLAAEWPHCALLRRLADDADVNRSAMAQLGLLNARCRVGRCHALSIPSLKKQKVGHARGANGRFLVEIGTENNALFQPANFFQGARCTAELPQTTEAETSALRDASTRPLEELFFAPNASSHSLPLPLLSPGVLREVVPALYSSPQLDWASPDEDDSRGRIRLGSSFCSIAGQEQTVLGFAREQEDGAWKETMYVRNLRTGASTSGEASTWGMAEWELRQLDVFETPRPPRLADLDASLQVPTSLSHLVIDLTASSHCRSCVVCAKIATVFPSCCGNKTAYCSDAHADLHSIERKRWCSHCSSSNDEQTAHAIINDGQ